MTERQKEAFYWRRKGLTLSQIGKKMRIDPSTVWKYLHIEHWYAWRKEYRKILKQLKYDAKIKKEKYHSNEDYRRNKIKQAIKNYKLRKRKNI